MKKLNQIYPNYQIFNDEFLSKMLPIFLPEEYRYPPWYHDNELFTNKQLFNYLFANFGHYYVRNAELFPTQLAQIWVRSTTQLYVKLTALQNLAPDDAKKMAPTNLVENTSGRIESTNPNTVKIGDNALTTISGLNAQSAEITQQSKTIQMVNPINFYHQINAIDFNNRLDEWLDTFKPLFLIVSTNPNTQEIAKINVINEVEQLGEGLKNEIIEGIKNNPDLITLLKGPKGEDATDEQVRKVLVRWIKDRHELFGQLVNDLNSEASQSLLNHLTTIIQQKNESYVDTFNSKVEELKNELNAAKQLINTPNPTIKQNSEQITTLKSGLSQFSTVLDQNISEINALKAKNGELKSEIDQANTKITTNESNVSTLQNTVNTINGNVYTNTNVLSKTTQRVNLILKDTGRIFTPKKLGSDNWRTQFREFSPNTTGFRVYIEPDLFQSFWGWYVSVNWGNNQNNTKKMGALIPAVYIIDKVTDSRSFWCWEGSSNGDLTVFCETYVDQQTKNYWTEWSYRFVRYTDGANIGGSNGLNVIIQTVYKDGSRITLNANDYPTEV